MKGLLRFQGTVLARTVSSTLLLLLLAGAVLMAWIAYSRSGFDRDAFALTAFAFLAILGVQGMLATFRAMETLRWAAPIGRYETLRAHLRFWLLVATPVAAVVALVHSRDTAEAAVLFIDLMLLVGAAASLVPWTHDARVGDVLRSLLFGGVFLLGVSATAVGLGLAWTRSQPAATALLACFFAVSAAMGVASERSRQLLPAASDANDVRTPAPDRPTPRGPVASLLRISYWDGLIPLSALVAFGLPLLISIPIVAILMPVSAASSMTRAGLATWRRLLPTPMDRGRAFRILFAPVLAFVLLATTARIVVLELTTERSKFFLDYRDQGGRGASSFNGLALYDVLEMDGEGKSYRTPEVPRIAAKIRAHLRRRYGLDVPQDRIAADLLRGWPAEPPTGIMDWDQRPTLNAVERLRVDLAPQIASAARRRDVAEVALAVLLFLGLFRIQLALRRRAAVWGGVASTLLVGAVVVPFFSPGAAATVERLHVAFQDGGWPATSLSLVAAAGVGVLLWRGAERSLRRLEVTDIWEIDAWSRREA